MPNDNIVISKKTLDKFDEYLSNIKNNSYGNFDYRELLTALQYFVINIRKDNESKTDSVVNIKPIPPLSLTAEQQGRIDIMEGQ